MPSTHPQEAHKMQGGGTVSEYREEDKKEAAMSSRPSSETLT